MDGVIGGVDGQRTALNVQKLLCVDGVVDGRVNMECQITDGQRRLAVLLRRRAGFDAVFAVGGDRQRSRAAERDGRAVLALDDGVFGIAVIGIIVVVVLLRVAQRVLRAMTPG